MLYYNATTTSGGRFLTSYGPTDYTYDPAHCQRNFGDQVSVPVYIVTTFNIPLHGSPKSMSGICFHLSIFYLYISLDKSFSYFLFYFICLNFLLLADIPSLKSCCDIADMCSSVITELLKAILSMPSTYYILCFLPSSFYPARNQSLFFIWLIAPLMYITSHFR